MFVAIVVADFDRLKKLQENNQTATKSDSFPGILHI